MRTNPTNKRISMDLQKLLNGVEAQEETSNEKTALPQGDYTVMIEKVEPKTNATTGNKGVSLQMKVRGAKYNNYTVFDYMGLTGSEKQLSYSLPKLKKLGLLTGSENTDGWNGKMVKISVSVDKQDATRNIVWGYGEPIVDDNTPISTSNKPAIDTSDIPF